jgi:hypothetical protein
MIYNNNFMKKIKNFSLIFTFFILLLGCDLDSNEDLRNKKQLIFNLSNKYGFKIEELNKKDLLNKQLRFENLEEYEIFLNYLRKEFNKESYFDYTGIKNILIKNGLNLEEILIENQYLKNYEVVKQTNFNRIQCIPSAMLVYARVRNMPLPGLSDGLNGVQIGMEFHDGVLWAKNTTWQMYGFYPFLNVKGGQIIQQNLPSFSNNYTSTLTAHYTVVWYAMIEDISIANFATMKVEIKINTCTGAMEIFWTEI